MELENTYLEILKAVKAQIKIPVALKLSPFFTSFGNFAAKMETYGADGLVLFNRFVETDVNISTLSAGIRPSFNDPAGFSRALRWIGLLSGRLTLDISGSGGVRDEVGVIKMLLAGASSVQFASLLYSKGLTKIQEILRGLEKWMEEKHFSSVSDFKGKLNQVHAPQKESYIRAQYIKAIAGIE